MKGEDRRSAVPSLEPSAEAASTPSRLARAVLQSFLEQRWNELDALTHPEADIETGFAVPGARFDKEQMLRSSWVASTSGAYKPEYDLIETLDENTALVAARLRYQIGKDLFSDREAVYVMSFKDGLFWRNRIFDSIDEALAAHHAGLPE